MKENLLKIIKFIGKILLKILKVIFLLPFSAYKFGKTYDFDEFEKDIEYIDK